MAATVDIANLVDRLPNAEDPVAALGDLQAALIATPVGVLRSVVPNVSFNVIFQLLDTTESPVIKLCCEVLSKLFSGVAATGLLHTFHAELEQGLSHPSEDVRSLCLTQLERACEEDCGTLSESSGLLVRLVQMLGENSVDAAKSVSRIFNILAGKPECLELLFSAAVVEQMQQTMTVSDEVRFRIYELVVDIACLTPDALNQCAASGLLQQLVNEVHKADVLIQLNCLELLKKLALCEHGLVYMDKQGIIRKFADALDNVNDDPMAGFLLPGLVKFFGNIAHIHPKETCDMYPGLLPLVYGMLEGSDSSQKLLGAETLALIGSSPEGKLVLARQGRPMTAAIQRIGKFCKDGDTKVRMRSMEGVSSLLKLQVADQTSELLAVTEGWFSDLFPSPLQTIKDIAIQPFTELHCSALSIVRSIALQPWGQRCMNELPAFNEYLLDRSTEKTKEGKEAKFKVVKTLVDSPTAMDIFGRPYFVRLKEYVHEGPFYKRVQAEVAMDGE